MLWLYWQLFPPDQRLPLRVQRGFLQHVLTSRLSLPNPPSISSSSPSFHVLPVKPNLFHKYSKPSLTQYGKEFSFRITFCLYRPRSKNHTQNCKSFITCIVERNHSQESSFRWRLAWCASSLGDLSSLMSANYLLKLFSCQNNLQSPIPAEKLSNLRWFWQIWGKLFPIILVTGFCDYFTSSFPHFLGPAARQSFFHNSFAFKELCPISPKQRRDKFD